MWQFIGIIVSPLKHLVFRILSRVHRTIRPRVAIVCGDELLLIRNWGDRVWSLPGGGAHRGESPEAAAARECAEELGVQISPDELRFLETVETSTHSAPVFLWQTAQKPVLTVQKYEITGARWVKRDELTNISTEVKPLVSRLNF